MAIKREMRTSQPAVVAHMLGVAPLRVADVVVADVLPNPNQPRSMTDPATLTELAASIKERGVLQPIIVSRLTNGRYQLVAGSRRLAAAGLAGLERIPAIVKVYGEDEADTDALIENVQRENLRFDDEARVLYALKERTGWSATRLGQIIGKSADYVETRLKAARNPETLTAVADGRVLIQDVARGQNPLATESATSPRRPHSAYRPLTAAVTTFARLTEARGRMDSDELEQARQYALKVREAADRFLDESEGINNEQV